MAPAVLDPTLDLSPSSTLTGTAYRNFVNPEWARLLSLLGMDIKYRRCLGTEFHTEDGRTIAYTLAERLTALTVMETVHSASFWSDALHLAQRAVRV
jgi:hypothetical protein